MLYSLMKFVEVVFGEKLTTTDKAGSVKLTWAFYLADLS